MNNKVQRRFDKSIREALDATKRADACKPRHDARRSYTEAKTKNENHRGWKLQLDQLTGATIYGP